MVPVKGLVVAPCTWELVHVLTSSPAVMLSDAEVPGSRLAVIEIDSVWVTPPISKAVGGPLTPSPDGLVMTYEPFHVAEGSQTPQLRAALTSIVALPLAFPVKVPSLVASPVLQLMTPKGEGTVTSAFSEYTFPFVPEVHSMYSAPLLSAVTFEVPHPPNDSSLTGPPTSAPENGLIVAALRLDRLHSVANSSVVSVDGSFTLPLIRD